MDSAASSFASMASTLGSIPLSLSSTSSAVWISRASLHARRFVAGVAAAERLSGLVKMSAERFRAKKRAATAMDFDDLLLGARDLLKNNLNIRRHYQEHFQALLVDEFQDTDEVQAEIISLLAEDPER